ncbi:MAG: class I SAM-dependent methyltransferase [Anaerolineaceae bacterium]|nr:class I SAM-dependent methyltransferase [Anaerolineaceae bacterium]
MENATLLDFLLKRNETVHEWTKIPWDEPDFSRRMLREHLSQDHDAASRRSNIIDQHVRWIHGKVLKGQPATILDLGCGPGFYTDRLTKLGHTCTGYDFGPASIEYAKANHEGTFHLGDLRKIDFGSDYDLVMLIFGELNAFSPEEAQAIIDKAYLALKQGGKLLLEVSRFASLAKPTVEPPTWFTSNGGLFSDKPYLCLIENRLDLGVLTTHHYVAEVGSDTIQTYSSMHQAYTDDEYRHLLRQFNHCLIYPSLMGSDEPDGDFIAIVAGK